uniref:Apolipoprotein M n=1 Tax=Electrophorus electricus TaxID=8005 RepID=A0A4W4GYE4_ELEEL
MTFLLVLGLIYAVAQVLVPCLPPIPLSNRVLTTKQYLGKWYYVGVGDASTLKWINCPSCLILGKLHPNDAFIRFMLFAHTKKTPSEVVERFKAKMGCFGVITEIILAPQTKGMTISLSIFSFLLFDTILLK